VTLPIRQQGARLDRNTGSEPCSPIINAAAAFELAAVMVGMTEALMISMLEPRKALSPVKSARVVAGVHAMAAHYTHSRRSG
jgi:hypothetical protein